ncbi:hypothetical protein Fmac_012763 [Flemingia macrophylla]|uniref:Sugar phosphate transporter domain-containing protein n=1 Tax=Flemingia macrophylla TaxID=520843 RepID=A0ABD1MR82_9FABA
MRPQDIIYRLGWKEKGVESHGGRRVAVVGAEEKSRRKMWEICNRRMWWSRIDWWKQQYYTTSGVVVGYAVCSSLLAIINKYAITKFNYPGLLTALQYLTSAAGVYLLGKLGFLHHDPFSLPTAKKFFPAALVFYLAIFTNTNLLRHANVDTFIVFRSLTPLLVALADTAFRHQPCPSNLTFLSLLVILAGAVGYVATDSAFTLTAYSWAFAYLVTITTEMVYIKHMVMNLGLGTWGFVFYNNLLSLMMAPFFWFLTGENLEVLAAVRSGSFDSAAFSAQSVTGPGSAPAQPKQLDIESNNGSDADDTVTGESDGRGKVTSR